MAKIVCYNGGKMSYYSCTDPDKLIVGKEYEVEAVHDRGWQTDYKLKGVEGEYNSVWFTEVSSTETVYMAIAQHPPAIGKSYSIYNIEFVDGKPKLEGRLTSAVNQIKYMGNNIYNVTTCNSTYIVKVG